MAALGPEASRQAAPVRRAVTECLGDVLGHAGERRSRPGPGARRSEALRVFASLVGAMVAARAVDDARALRRDPRGGAGGLGER